jgi:hypothetical protein
MSSQKERTAAAIIANGRIVCTVYTDGYNGEVVEYGFQLIDEEIHASRIKNLLTVGTGKISRAKKWLESDTYYLADNLCGYCEGATATLEEND